MEDKKVERSIEGSDLLRQHLGMIQQQAHDAMRRAVRSEMETRGLSPEEWAFDAQAMAFVKHEAGEDQ